MTLFSTRRAAIGLRRILRTRWTPLLSAVAVGTLTAGLLCTGFVAGFLSNQTSDTTIQLPRDLAGLHATATSGSENS